MTSQRYGIATYPFDASVTYFIDTNVWFLVYGPASPTDRRVPLYSDAVKRLRSSGAAVLIDAVVVSEFVNAWTRFGFHRRGGRDFKVYRESDAFKPVAQEIAIALRSILKFATRIQTPFANLDLNPVLDDFERGGADFNDLLIVETCQSRSCILITDDRDMKTAPVPIVTANALILT